MPSEVSLLESVQVRYSRFSLSRESNTCEPTTIPKTDCGESAYVRFLAEKAV